MINEKELTKISKLLSLVLRHRPEAIKILLDENGWTDVTILIDKMNKHNQPITLEILKHVVDTNAKKRFTFNDVGDKIRANQGHSVEVELGYESEKPPTILFHGTGIKSVAAIKATGLNKRDRHHVHLSADSETALKVGQRHGTPFIFEILAEEMYKNNYLFYKSDNGVWLTDNVPSKYLREMESYI